MKTTVFASLTFEATHNWPQCNIKEVEYLKHEHRHVFHITAYVEVSHDDRDVEFIVLKHRIKDYLEEFYPENKLGATSCEMLASELVEAFNLVKCIVSEDGENGAVVEL